MADKRIGDIPEEALSINEEDLFVLEQNGTAKRLSGETLVTDLLGMIDGHGGIKSVTWSATGTSGDGQVHTGTFRFTDNTTSTVSIKDGVKGDRGSASYVWIKWASKKPTTNADMSDTPSAWMGVYSGTASTAPASYTQYKWFNIKGSTGAAAKLSSRTVMYMASSSGTNPNGTWQSTVPSVAPGQYLWTHITLTFSGGGQDVDWYEVARQGRNGVDGLGAVSTVNNVSPDANNNVSLAASNIPYSNTNVGAALSNLSGDVSGKQPTINVSGMLKGSGSGAVSKATLGVDYGAKSGYITLPKDDGTNWVGNQYTIKGSLFKYTAAENSGFTYYVSPDTDSAAKYAECQIMAKNIVEDGKMVFVCSTPPDQTLYVNIVRAVSYRINERSGG